MRLVPSILWISSAAIAVFIAGHALDTSRATTVPAETIAVAAASFAFPLPGEHLVDGRVAASPVVSSGDMAFNVMRYQVSRADYAACVTAAVCSPPATRSGPDDAPVTGVSFVDAETYAAWYSEMTGQTWRLPTAMEAAAAAAERFAGTSDIAADPSNPAARWLRRYSEEAAAKRVPDPTPKPAGFYGANTRGLADFGGNVWEWTSTCYARVTLAADGGVLHATENCGVRVLEGRHRAYMTDFIRDGVSGGCAVGTPPDNLGFRLVRESPTIPSVAWLSALIGTVTAI